MRCIIRDRSTGFMFCSRRALKALRAAATAMSTSAAFAQAMSAMTSPVAGLTTGMRVPSRLSTKRPSI